MNGTNVKKKMSSIVWSRSKAVPSLLSTIMLNRSSLFAFLAFTVNVACFNVPIKLCLRKQSFNGQPQYILRLSSCVIFYEH